MNMHKSKGKQFDEVIIFEGWPQKVAGQRVKMTYEAQLSDQSIGAYTCGTYLGFTPEENAYYTLKGIIVPPKNTGKTGWFGESIFTRYSCAAELYKKREDGTQEVVPFTPLKIRSKRIACLVIEPIPPKSLY